MENLNRDEQNKKDIEQKKLAKLSEIYDTKNWTLNKITAPDEYEPGKQVFVRNELAKKFDTKLKVDNNFYKGIHPESVLHVTIPNKDKNQKVMCTPAGLWDIIESEYHFIPSKSALSNKKEQELYEKERLIEIGRYTEEEFDPKTYKQDESLEMEILNIKGLGAKFVKIDGKKVFDPETPGGIFVLDGNGNRQKLQSVIKGKNTENFIKINLDNGKSVKLSDNMSVLDTSYNYKNVAHIKKGDKLTFNNINPQTHENRGETVTVTSVTQLGLSTQDFYQLIYVKQRVFNDYVWINGLSCKRKK